MFPFDQAALPALTGRKALLIVDFQNDFINPYRGKLPVISPEGFVERTLRLVGQFRSIGDIVWVQSHFDRPRLVDADEVVISDAIPPLGPPTLSTGVDQRNVLEHPLMPEPISSSNDPEAFLSCKEPLCLLPSEDEGKAVPPIVERSMKATDITLNKSHYSAFKGTQLLRMLRAKMVMDVFICGSLMNIGVYATALDAAGHGMNITVVEDCSGFRHESRHSKAIKNLIELTGCEIASAQEVLELIPLNIPASQVALEQEGAASGAQSKPPVESTSPTKPNSARESLSPSIIDHLKELNLVSSQLSSATDEDTSALELTQKNPITINSNPAQADGPGEQSSPPDRQKDTKTLADPLIEELAPSVTPSSSTSEAPGSQENDTMASDARSSKSGCDPHAHVRLCEGDTDVIEPALCNALADEAFEKLKHEVCWQRMSHQGGEVPRLVAVQGEILPDGGMPIYRHPADESPPLLPFSPTVLAIKGQVEKHLGHHLNHVLIQLYRDGNDFISEHSDKTLDIVQGSFIANISLGAERTMVLRTKRPDKDPSRTEPVPNDSQRKIQRVQLPHNSLFRMGLKTNMKWLHAIRQDKRAQREKSASELAYSGCRISLTFRQIGTFLDRDEVFIWGQGASSKSRDTAHRIINGQSPSAIEMLQAFGMENHASNFDWERYYGAGFDVLHIRNSPRFFSCSDPIINLCLSWMLAEYQIDHAKGSAAAAVSLSSSSYQTAAESVKFIDNDMSKSVVYGHFAIMLYIDARYAQSTELLNGRPKDQDTELAKRFTLFQRGLNLHRIWEKSKEDAGNDTQFILGESLKQELQAWNGFVANTTKKDIPTFIAGTALSLPDFAFWPVLHGMVLALGSQVFDGLSSLEIYYSTVKAFESTMKALKTWSDKG